ncbi:hypothetical protein OC846_006371 [Tilletia horrida]|uniref:WD40 repeat-like protein n=1 Tax=Tilletia horrida TaxID=155126 RepID=A0AAN6JNQ3_9BASI|nr:hypothetical protein OC846_006371 [Tilletia horrida]
MVRTFTNERAWPRFTSIEEALVLCAGGNLLAVGGSSQLQVLQLSAQTSSAAWPSSSSASDAVRADLLISFDVSAPVAAIAWSPVTSGPQVTMNDAAEEEDNGGFDGMRIELSVALDDGKVIVFSHAGGSTTSLLLGKVSSRVNSMDWINIDGRSHLAAAQGDGTLSLWTLEAPETLEEGLTQALDQSSQIYKFSTSLLTVAFHPQATGTLLVLDAAGSVKMLDWLNPSLPHHKQGKDETVTRPTSGSRKPRAVHTFIDPVTFAEAHTSNRANSSALLNGDGSAGLGAASWKPQDENVVGALLDGRWCIWDARTSAGNGLPVERGEAYGSPGGGGFKWCPTNAQLFLTFSTASRSSIALGPRLGGSGGDCFSGASPDDVPLTIYDRSSLMLSAPRRIARSELLPFDADPPASTSPILLNGQHRTRLAGTSAVRGERVQDVEWIGSALGGGLRAGAAPGAGAGVGPGLGDVVAVAMGREVIFVGLN